MRALGDIQDARCYKCTELKPLDDFNKDRHRRGGVDAYCKKCRHNFRKKPSRPAKLKPQVIPRIVRSEEERKMDAYRSSENCRLKRKYGITLEEVDRLRENQGGLCAIRGCGRDAKVIDHCHTTGIVRGLLCDGCNKSLGFLKEDPSRILGLLDYIQG